MTDFEYVQPMNNIFLLTGGNLGDRRANLQLACNLIEQTIGSLVALSKIYETAAWGITDQPSFLNQVLHIQTPLSAHDVLNKTLAIESQIGRTRTIKFGPRIIDIDLLFFNNEIIQTDNLIIPHPEIQHRRFVLEPLNQIAAAYIHPILKKTVSQLLADCTDPLEVTVYSD